MEMSEADLRQRYGEASDWEIRDLIAEGEANFTSVAWRLLQAEARHRKLGATSQSAATERPTDERTKAGAPAGEAPSAWADRPVGLIEAELLQRYGQASDAELTELLWGAPHIFPRARGNSSTKRRSDEG